MIARIGNAMTENNIVTRTISSRPTAPVDSLQAPNTRTARVPNSGRDDMIGSNRPRNRPTEISESRS